MSKSRVSDRLQDGISRISHRHHSVLVINFNLLTVKKQETIFVLDTREKLG